MTRETSGRCARQRQFASRNGSNRASLRLRHPTEVIARWRRMLGECRAPAAAVRNAVSKHLVRLHRGAAVLGIASTMLFATSQQDAQAEKTLLHNVLHVLPNFYAAAEECAHDGVQGRPILVNGRWILVVGFTTCPAFNTILGACLRNIGIADDDVTGVVHVGRGRKGIAVLRPQRPEDRVAGATRVGDEGLRGGVEAAVLIADDVLARACPIGLLGVRRVAARGAAIAIGGAAFGRGVPARL